jgi:hypothetical protein
MEIAEILKPTMSEREDEMDMEIENLALALFPFLLPPKNPEELYPLNALWRRYILKARGLVICSKRRSKSVSAHRPELPSRSICMESM